MCVQALKKKTYPVQELRVALATSRYHHERQVWINSMSHVPEVVHVNCTEGIETIIPYYRPQLNTKRNQIEIGIDIVYTSMLELLNI